MAHHGHKTEERAHVLINKNKIISDSKARKARFLCLSSMSALGLVMAGGLTLNTTSAHAQDDDRVYASSNAGQKEIRLQQMETQIRNLTGRVEEQLYEINSLKQKVKLLETSPSSTSFSNTPKRNVPVNNTQMGSNAAVAPAATSVNPLGLDLKAQDPKGMQSKSIVAASGDATQQYEQSYAALKRGDFEASEKGFKAFLAEHSDHVLAANAKYWLGETHYVRGDYKKSARIFAEGFQMFPDSAKSPDILLKLGMSLKGLGKKDDACVALGQVPVKFPVGNNSVLELAEQERKALSCGS